MLPRRAGPPSKRITSRGGIRPRVRLARLRTCSVAARRQLPSVTPEPRGPVSKWPTTSERLGCRLVEMARWAHAGNEMAELSNERGGRRGSASATATTRCSRHAGGESSRLSGASPASACWTWGVGTARRRSRRQPSLQSRGFCSGPCELSGPMLAEAGDEPLNSAQLVSSSCDSTPRPPRFPGPFDVMISRFGVHALRGSRDGSRQSLQGTAAWGRMCFVCWQEMIKNEWLRVPLLAAVESTSASLNFLRQVPQDRSPWRSRRPLSTWRLPA